MRYSLVFLLICFFLSSFEKKMPNYEKCKDCSYKGGISKATIDTLTGNYKPTVIQLGELLYSLDIEICKLKKHGKLELRGIVVAPIPKGDRLNSPVSNIHLLSCIRKGDLLKVQETIAISDMNGRFSLSAKVKEGHYVVIKQNNNTGIVYSLLDFRVE